MQTSQNNIKIKYIINKEKTKKLFDKYDIPTLYIDDLAGTRTNAGIFIFLSTLKNIETIENELNEIITHEISHELIRRQNIPFTIYEEKCLYIFTKFVSNKIIKYKMQLQKKSIIKSYKKYINQQNKDIYDKIINYLIIFYITFIDNKFIFEHQMKRFKQWQMKQKITTFKY